jgi:hypothetical protein
MSRVQQEYAEFLAALPTMSEADLIREVVDHVEGWSGPNPMGDGTVGLRVEEALWAELKRRALLISRRVGS